MTVASPVTGGTAPDEVGTERPNPWRWVVLVVIAGLATFWVWALFFASKESINRIDDHAWAERAAAICTAADSRREELADYRRVDAEDAAMLAERGDIVDRATDVVEQMLDDVVAVVPADPKGRELVPLWEADYRTYLADRRTFADGLRAGHNEAFAETSVDGIPISDKLARFAADNHMPDCAPPIDLG